MTRHHDDGELRGHRSRLDVVDEGFIQKEAVGFVRGPGGGQSKGGELR